MIMEKPCPYCVEHGFLCQDNPIHLSHIYARDTKEGRDISAKSHKVATQDYVQRVIRPGVSFCQGGFLEGYHAFHNGGERFARICESTWEEIWRKTVFNAGFDTAKDISCLERLRI